MVDIGATRQRHLTAHSIAHRAASETFVEVRPADDLALADYRAFCAPGLHAPAQHPVWIRAWEMATGADMLVATIHRQGRPAFALVLEVVRDGPFRVARFPGGDHANGNFVAMAHASHGPVTRDEAQALKVALRDARPDIDIVVLQRQNPTLDGIRNPFFEVGRVKSPNVSLAVDLAGGFEQVLERAGSKKKRKKYRFQINKFKEMGGHRTYEAATPEEVDRLIGEFFVMKASRFRQKGISDVFGPADVRAFFRALYRDALDEPVAPFRLHGLEVGGTLRAVNGLSFGRRTVTCEFGGIRDDMSNASPGYFLDYTNIQQACDAGMDVYDFSVGEEDYKRSWCDIETWQFETLLPISPRGRAAMAWKWARARLLHVVKNNDTLWRAVKRLRQLARAGRTRDV